MARSHLTLAALATSAVAELDVAQARAHSLGAHGRFDSALLVGRDGRRLIIRVPRSQAAETEQSADLVALRALTIGNRSRLPFDVPQFVGQAPAGGTRAVVYELLPGDAFDANALTGHAGVSGSIGRAIAAIHGLPTAFVGTAGLPQQTAAECRAGAIDVIDRAADTGYLPAAILRRWEQATDDDALWQFPPTVIHGSLAAESFLITDDAVSGILGWAGLSVGDPARDLHWLLAARGAEAEAAITAYSTARQGSDPRITQRAMLYAEMELARWLLHGTATRNQAIVDDAVVMLDGLVENVHSQTMHPLSPATAPVLDVTAVESMLQSTPRGAPRPDNGSAMHTDAYDMSAFRKSEFDDGDSDYGDSDDRALAETGAIDQPRPFHDSDAATGPVDIGRATDDQAATRSSSE
ncbi:phosphotransferase [Cryobacterium tagatosivorans]|uniref:Macrolide 2'-phosphotransferase n=1 Tax=Cryobacterium tagatosivorans TaxID=1259199 RepID=A0A4R8UDZ3_9MICO|nr:phosphotransferase [Cryobacterium tagatosivorans]TFB51260.1 macrolide 2'-phosphotransferase [Cryobacterium tagatosivorans]